MATLADDHVMDYVASVFHKTGIKVSSSKVTSAISIAAPLCE